MSELEPCCNPNRKFGEPCYCKCDICIPRNDLPVQIKVGRKEKLVVIQSMGNDLIPPNYIIVEPKEAREIAGHLLRIANEIERQS